MQGSQPLPQQASKSGCGGGRGMGSAAGGVGSAVIAVNCLAGSPFDMLPASALFAATAGVAWERWRDAGGSLSRAGRVPPS